MHADTDVIIIGGGIGGLAVGAYLQMNGYQTRILEMGRECGGVSVSWRRGDYVFDGATNWLPGSSPSSNIHPILADIIDFSKLPIDPLHEFMRIEDSEGVFHVYSDVDRLRAEMKRIAAEDETKIDEFCDAIKYLSRLEVPFDTVPELLTPVSAIGFLFANMPVIRFYSRWSGISIAQYTSAFRNDRLRRFIRRIFPHHEFFSVLSVVMTLAWMHAGAAGYPRGGSARFRDLVQQRYESLGGIIELRKKVTSIIVENNAARGVRCGDGSEYRARDVISAADGHETIFGMLNGRYVNGRIRKIYSRYRVFPSLLQVSLGVNTSFPDAPAKLVLELDAPLRAGAETLDCMMVRVCNFDPHFAPEGKTPFIVHFRTHDYAYWQNLRAENRAAYREEKQRIADHAITELERRFGPLRDALEEVDVATPATFQRYTGIWKGSYQGWAPSPGIIGKNVPKTLPGLRNFYITGQWIATPGGLPRVIALGKHVAQIMCKRDKKAFTALPAQANRH
jgi:phytoene dehydrogenase-like protein